MSDKSGLKLEYTPRESELLGLAMQCSKDPAIIPVDYAKLAQIGGFKTAASANASWLVLKKKIMKYTVIEPKPSDDNGNDATPTKAKPKPKKRTPKVKAEAEIDTPADDEHTPTNTPKKKGGVKRKAAAIESSSPEVETAHPNTTDGEAAATDGGHAAADGGPVKKKRANTRKAKDPNATPTKRGKKGVKAELVSETDLANDESNAHVTDGDHEGSVFGDGIKKEEHDDNDHQSQQYAYEGAELTEEQHSAMANALDEGIAV